MYGAECFFQIEYRTTRRKNDGNRWKLISESECPKETINEDQTEYKQPSSINRKTSTTFYPSNRYNIAAQTWRNNQVDQTHSSNKQLRNRSKALPQNQSYPSKIYYRNKSTQSKTRRICPYYLKNCCIFGKSCFNIHEDPPENEVEDNHATDGTLPFRAGAQ